MERTGKPTAAGVLSIICGTVEIFVGVSVLGFGRIMGALSDWLTSLLPVGPNLFPFASITTTVAGIIFLVFGIIALVGGIFAIRRKWWGGALAGAIFSFPIIPFGGILGLIAVILVSLGKKEFE